LPNQCHGMRQMLVDEVVISALVAVVPHHAPYLL
jgi:hypothetical protein